MPELGKATYVIEGDHKGLKKTIKESRREVLAFKSTVDDTDKSVKQLDTDVENTGTTLRLTDKDVKKINTSLDRLSTSIGGVGRENKAMAATFTLVKWPAIWAGISMVGQAVNGLLAGVVGLGSALAPTVGVLAAMPAGLTALVSSLVVTKLAFKDLGKAIEGDEKALKKFGPAGREFVAFVKDNVMPLGKELRQLAQGAIFPGITRGVKEAFNVGNIAAFKQFVVDTGSAVGTLATKLGTELANPRWALDLNTMSEQNRRTIVGLGDALIKLLPAFRDLTIAAGPFVEWMVKGVGALSQWIADSTHAARMNGKLAGFFEKTKESLRLLWGILKPLGQLFLEIGKAAAPLGRTILRDLGDQLDRAAKWAKTEGGRRTLKKYFDDAKPILYETARLLRDISKFLLDLGQAEPGGPLLTFMERLRKEVLPIFSEASQTSLQQFGMALTDAAIGIAKLLGALAGSNGPLTVFVGIIADLANGFADLILNNPGLREFLFIMTGVVGITKVLTFVGITKGLTAAIPLFFNLGVGATAGATGMQRLNMAMRANVIGLIVTAIQVVIGIIILLEARFHIFSRAWAATWDFIKDVTVRFWNWLKPYVTSAWEATVTFVKRALEVLEQVWGTVWPRLKEPVQILWNYLKNSAKNAIEVMRGVINVAMGILTGDWKRAWDGLKTIAGAVWEQIKNTARTFITGFIPWLLRSGADLGHALINGIKEGIKAAIPSALDVVKWAGDKIIGHLSVGWKMRSPSRVTMKMGEDLVRGLEIGIQNATPRVLATVKRLAVRATQALKQFFKPTVGNWQSLVEQAFGKKQGAEKTATELEIERRESERAMQQAAEEMDDAKRELAEAIAEGDIERVKAAQRRIADAEYQAWLAGAQRQAEAERKDLEYRQQIEQQNFQARMNEIVKRLNEGTLKGREAVDTMSQLLTDFGLTGFDAAALLGEMYAQGIINSIPLVVDAVDQMLRAADNRITNWREAETLAATVAKTARKGDAPKPAKKPPAKSSGQAAFRPDNKTSKIDQMVSFARAMGIAVTSTNGGSHVAGSLHYQNRAIDVAGSMTAMRNFFNRAISTFGGRIDELFFDPMGYYIDRGQRRQGAIGGHGDHVHLGLFGQGGVVTEPTLAMIGENAATTPEIVTPEKLMRQVVRDELKATGSGGPLVNIERMDVKEREDATAIAAKLSRKMATARNA